MSRKPRPTVSVGAKISPKLADKLYEFATSEFGGSISEAVREGIKLIIVTKAICHAKLSPELADRFYKLVDEEFGGNLGEAVRAAVKLLLSKRFPLEVQAR